MVGNKQRGDHVPSIEIKLQQMRHREKRRNPFTLSDKETKWLSFFLLLPNDRQMSSYAQPNAHGTMQTGRLDAFKRKNHDLAGDIISSVDQLTADEVIVGHDLAHCGAVFPLVPKRNRKKRTLVSSHWSKS